MQDKELMKSFYISFSHRIIKRILFAFMFEVIEANACFIMKNTLNVHYESMLVKSLYNRVINFVS